MKYVYRIVKRDVRGATELANYGITLDSKVANDIVKFVQDKSSPSVILITSVPLYDSLEDYKDNCPESIRQRALQKLTWDERIALGLEK